MSWADAHAVTCWQEDVGGPATGFVAQPQLEDASIKQAFDAFADAETNTVDTEKVVDVVRYLNLAVPENLPKLILSVSDGNPSLSFAAIKSLCGLIFGKGPLLETSPKQKQVGTRRNYLENGNLTEDEAVLSFMRALEVRTPLLTKPFPNSSHSPLCEPRIHRLAPLELGATESERTAVACTSTGAQEEVREGRQVQGGTHGGEATGGPEDARGAEAQEGHARTT